jgi:quinol monooxygenase YgiN
MTGYRPALIVLAVACVYAGSPSAQSADTARYAVAYVEVTPAGVAQAAMAFRTYRQSAAGEAGFASFELFEQIGRPGHLAIIEGWRDQAAFDAHQAAASLATLKNALQPIRTTGYDQRPYKPLTLAPAKEPAGKNAIVVVSHVDIGGGGQVDVPAMLRRLADASRVEPGCLRFDVTQHTARANHFTVVEIWADQQALDRHAAAAHTKQYRDEVQPVSGSPLDERVYRRLE